MMAHTKSAPEGAQVLPSVEGRSGFYVWSSGWLEPRPVAVVGADLLPFPVAEPQVFSHIDDHTVGDDDDSHGLCPVKSDSSQAVGSGTPNAPRATGAVSSEVL
jgi:hypothetical protein